MNQDILQQQFYLFHTTLWLTRIRVIHQHIVDALTADENTKSIAIASALIGLCLYLEKDYTGKQVQIGPHGARASTSENGRSSIAGSEGQKLRLLMC